MSAPPEPPLLLVEDDDDVASVVEHVLRREGFVVERAVDGRQAAARVSSGTPPAAVILGLMLPYHDGHELLAMIRAAPAWADVPVLMLSAKALEKDIVRAFDGGADDYVAIPFAPRELVARLRRRLARTRR